MVALFASIILRSKPDLPTFINAMNSVGAQPTALITLMLGCTMLILCKTYSLSTDIAAGIIGCGINMLTNQFSKTHVDPTGKITQDTTIPNTPTTPPTTNLQPSATNQEGPSDESSPPAATTTTTP
jgi:hypothetical protein